jgi:enoyl-CoA hydratase/carnithine racemase
MKDGASQSCIQRRGPVAVVEFKNEPSGLITVKGAAQLSDSVEELLQDSSIQAIVLTGGTPGAFIRHADVSQILRAGEALAANRVVPADFLISPFTRLTRLCETASVPVIAAIDGVCMGGGFEIALCCTFRIAGRGVKKIGLPEIRLGIFPGSGGIQRLGSLLGTHQARAFILRGAVVGAQQALTMGLIDEIADSAIARAVELANELARRPPAAVRAIIELSRRNDLEAGLQEEVTRFAMLLRDHPEILARLRAFVTGGESLDKIP